MDSVSVLINLITTMSLQVYVGLPVCLFGKLRCRVATLSDVMLSQILFDYDPEFMDITNMKSICQVYVMFQAFLDMIKVTFNHTDKFITLFGSNLNS